MTIAIGQHAHALLPGMTNRHGLVTGATGTGNTVTIHAVAEHLSALGVPVFLADVKGDLAGISQPAGDNPKVAERVATLKLADWRPAASPVLLWDIFGKEGNPIRTPVSEMGPLLLDLKDLRALLQYVGENRKTFTTEYGNVSAASIGAIQRSLLALEEGGGEALFGEPALDLADFMRVTPEGKGMVSLLSAERLMASPKIYATFLLWLLAELFEQLPEVGDPDNPKLDFFLDEAHLLFADAPDAPREKIEQIVRLIRSKGIKIFFITKNPLDIPDSVLGLLGNRLQHALREHTPTRPEGDQDRGGDLPRQPGPRRGRGHHRARRRRGPRLVPGRAGGAGDRRAGPRHLAPLPDRPHHAGATGRDHRPSPGRGHLSDRHRPRIGLRAPQDPGRGGGSRGRAGRSR